MKASELIGSQVLELYGATMCGTVCGIIPTDNLKKIKALEILTECEDDCEKKYIETSKITAVDKGIVTIKCKDLLVMQYPEVCSPINLPSYSEKGESYGRITDVTIDEKFNVISLHVHGRTFKPSDVLNNSDELIVFRLPGSKTKIVKTVKRIPKTAERTTVKIAEGSADEHIAPTVRIMEFKRHAYLIGKTLTEDVTDMTGAPVAVRGEQVTEELINRAKMRGTIVKLTMAAK